MQPPHRLGTRTGGKLRQRHHRMRVPHRLQAGPYASRDLARETAEQVRSGLQLAPMIVERR